MKPAREHIKEVVSECNKMGGLHPEGYPCQDHLVEMILQAQREAYQDGLREGINEGLRKAAKYLKGKNEWAHAVAVRNLPFTNPSEKGETE